MVGRPIGSVILDWEAVDRPVLCWVRRITDCQVKVVFASESPRCRHYFQAQHDMEEALRWRVEPTTWVGDKLSAYPRGAIDRRWIPVERIQDDDIRLRVAACIEHAQDIV